MQAKTTRAEPRAQAISWLVSQLRWEATLGELRHSELRHGELRHGGTDPGRAETARAA